jgi:hypothetical protein
MAPLETAILLAGMLPRTSREVIRISLNGWYIEYIISFIPVLILNSLVVHRASPWNHPYLQEEHITHDYSVCRITTSSVCVSAPQLILPIAPLPCVGTSLTRWAVNLSCLEILTSMEHCKRLRRT